MKDRRKSWQGKTKTPFTKCGHLTRARGRNIADANRRQKPKTLAEYADAMGITETEAQRLMEKANDQRSPDDQYREDAGDLFE